MAGTGVACILIFPAAFTPLLLGLHDYKNLARRDDSITGDYYPDLMHYEIEETVGEWITHWFVSSLMIALLCAFPVAAALWALAQ
ncbi:MAG TPA: hypothetical protein VFL98_01715 [Candidatus Paceibacterota bacterium]|nr:hypothetical protein [Candidatus Paceibacterota bacterium]